MSDVAQWMRGRTKLNERPTLVWNLQTSLAIKLASERAQKRCSPYGELHLSRYDLLRGRVITNGNGDNHAATSSDGAANKLG